MKKVVIDTGPLLAFAKAGIVSTVKVSKEMRKKGYYLSDAFIDYLINE